MAKLPTTLNTILLAYSGGLDTSTIIPWLQEHYPHSKIIAMCIDVGQVAADEGPAMEARALACGAHQFILEDQTQVFLEEYVWPTLQAHAVYEGEYLLGTSMARPLIGKRLAQKALEVGADAICHGATGKGNDQVRFELAIKAFAPQLPILAPWRVWALKSREDEMAYLQQRGLNLPFSVEQSYSRDENVWHLSHEGLELEDPAMPPNYATLLQKTLPLQQAADTPETVHIGFEQGIPTSVNGQALGSVALLTALNAIAKAHGVGVVDMVENRLVGMKSRGVYETPGGTLLYKAHAELERLCLDRATLAFKNQSAITFAQLVYDGLWFSPLREALSAFVNETQRTVSGEVALTLYKGNVQAAGSTSPFSLYSEALASFATGDLFDHADAGGFINLFGLSTQMRALQAQQRQAAKA
jgi:argininosuccinate synthase